MSAATAISFYQVRRDDKMDRPLAIRQRSLQQRNSCDNATAVDRPRFTRKRSSMSLSERSVGHTSEATNVGTACASPDNSVFENPRSCKASKVDPAMTPVSALGHCIAEWVFAPAVRRRSSSSSSGSSSSSSNSDCSFLEESIVPVEVDFVEATPKFTARVQHKGSTGIWGPRSLRKGSAIKVSSSHDRLTAWKVDNDKFVFGYETSRSTLYVEAPDSDGSRLKLTDVGSDPANISNPSNDQRVFQVVYDRAAGGHKIRSVAFNLWVVIEGTGRSRYAIVRDMSQRNVSATWSVEPV